LLYSLYLTEACDLSSLSQFVHRHIDETAATQIKLSILLSQFGRIAVEYPLEFVIQIQEAVRFAIKRLLPPREMRPLIEKLEVMDKISIGLED
jgi:hypothetical protein